MDDRYWNHVEVSHGKVVKSYVSQEEQALNAAMAKQRGFFIVDGDKMDAERLSQIRVMIRKHYLKNIIVVLLFVALFFPFALSALLKEGMGGIYFFGLVVALVFSAFCLAKSCSVKCNLLENRRFSYCTAIVTKRHYQRSRGMYISVTTGDREMDCYVFGKPISFGKNETVQVILFDCSQLSILSKIAMPHETFAMKFQK